MHGSNSLCKGIVYDECRGGPRDKTFDYQPIIKNSKTRTSTHYFLGIYFISCMLFNYRPGEQRFN